MNQLINCLINKDVIALTTLNMLSNTIMIWKGKEAAWLIEQLDLSSGIDCSEQHQECTQVDCDYFVLCLSFSDHFFSSNIDLVKLQFVPLAYFLKVYKVINILITDAVFKDSLWYSLSYILVTWLFLCQYHHFLLWYEPHSKKNPGIF